MTLTELKKYYLDKRHYEYEQRIPLKNFTTRKIIHPFPLAAITLSRISEGQEITIIDDKREKNSFDVKFHYFCGKLSYIPGYQSSFLL